MNKFSSILRRSVRGFSLLELVFVLAIMGILLAIVLGSYHSVLQAGAITTGADLVRDTLSEGRSSALAQNITVEVRFYQLPVDAGPSPAYCALQLHWLKSDGTTPPIAQTSFLPTGAVLDATADHSPLIGVNTQTVTPDATDPRLNSGTRVFHFFPDGSTDLHPSTNWFLTVRAATASDPTHFPSNWAAIQIDPATGRAQIYRP